ncbi:MAG: Cystathionine gamma-lyase [Candidatus Carbobacillus altaicus]|uniref:Cystathionine gamma-lyase n=1 Tax=Candidatus Carbonibacillus altaicus TaxID=2163959 RepID=A0A2R6XZN2_9BACL|nr:MAG: Cystathionine gamma-lyase [Candidatus Carbobacillus altaicus]
MGVRIKTKLIHGGRNATYFGDETTGAVNVPVFLSSTFKQDGPGKHRGFEYSRTANPTRAALEALIADLEEGHRGFAFASGMAAMTTVMMLFEKGDHIIVGDDVYGGTYRLMTRVLSGFGLEVTFVDVSTGQVQHGLEGEQPLTEGAPSDDMREMDPLATLAAALQPNTRAVMIETPTNPLLRIVDIAAVASFCRQHGLLLIVDNTFMTPYWQRPLELGADIVIHSATKYLSGHSDIVAGLVVVRDEALAERLHFLQNATGGILAPHDAYLLIRGIRTLSLRMEAHEHNAATIAHFLTEREDIRRVYYPGLATHPGHAVMRKQSRGFGGIVSFEVESGEQAGQIARAMKLFTLAESLGAVESLISIPARMTHASIPEERRKTLGITDGLIRLSVGIEDVDDLLSDLAQALETTRTRSSTIER